MTTINLELPCEISECENFAYLAGTKIVVLKFVEHEKNCSMCEIVCSCLDLCHNYERTDSRNGHWCGVQGNDNVDYRISDNDLTLIENALSLCDPNKTNKIRTALFDEIRGTQQSADAGRSEG